MSMRGWNICSATNTKTIITRTINKNRIHLRYLGYFIYVLTNTMNLDMSVSLYSLCGGKKSSVLGEWITAVMCIIA